MGIIRNNYLFRGIKSKALVSAMFDSGASDSCISPEIAQQLSELLPLEEPFNAVSIDENHQIRIDKYVHLFFEINGVLLNDLFYVVPSLSEPIIVGASTMQKYRLKLDFEHDNVIVNPQLKKVELKNIKIDSII